MEESLKESHTHNAQLEPSKQLVGFLILLRQSFLRLTLTASLHIVYPIIA